VPLSLTFTKSNRNSSTYSGTDQILQPIRIHIFTRSSSFSVDQERSFAEVTNHKTLVAMKAGWKHNIPV
jgi:hypothetical protein